MQRGKQPLWRRKIFFVVVFLVVNLISIAFLAVREKAAVNQKLFDLSGEIYKAFCDIPETTLSEYYKPFSWLPHITLGKTLDKVQMQKAFQTMQEKFIPFTARFGEIGLAKVNPHEDVTKFTLL